jgi:hypothetical protein
MNGNVPIKDALTSDEDCYRLALAGWKTHFIDIVPKKKKTKIAKKKALKQASKSEDTDLKRVLNRMEMTAIKLMPFGRGHCNLHHFSRCTLPHTSSHTLLIIKMITPITRRAVTATFTFPRAVRSFTTTQKLAFANDKAVANPNIKVTHFEDGKPVDGNVKVKVTAAPAMQAGIPYFATRLKTHRKGALADTNISPAHLSTSNSQKCEGHNMEEGCAGIHDLPCRHTLPYFVLRRPWWRFRTVGGGNPLQKEEGRAGIYCLPCRHALPHMLVDNLD